MKQIFKIKIKVDDYFSFSDELMFHFF